MAIWSSKLQKDIALSTMEAEYNAHSMGMKDPISFHNCVNSVATSVGLDDSIKTCFLTTVWEDNNRPMVLASQEPGHMMR